MKQTRKHFRDIKKGIFSRKNVSNVLLSTAISKLSRIDRGFYLEFSSHYFSLKCIQWDWFRRVDSFSLEFDISAGMGIKFMEDGAILKWRVSEVGFYTSFSCLGLRAEVAWWFNGLVLQFLITEHWHSDHEFETRQRNFSFVAF